MNIIATALTNYDNSRIKYNEYYTGKYEIVIHEDKIEKRRFEIKLNDNIIKIGYCNILGIYFPENNTFVWGWSLPFRTEKNSNKNETYLSRKILNYALDMQFSSRDPLLYELRIELLTNKIKIEHPYQLEKLLAFALYITKTEMIYKSKNEYSNVDVWYLFEKLENP